MQFHKVALALLKLQHTSPAMTFAVAVRRTLHAHGVARRDDVEDTKTAIRTGTGALIYKRCKCTK